jgi:hypothetical protein
MVYDLLTEYQNESQITINPVETCIDSIPIYSFHLIPIKYSSHY